MVSRSVRRLRKLYPVILQLRHGGEIHLPEARLDAHEPPARPAPSARPRRLSPCGRPEGTEGGSPSAPPPPAGADPPQLPPTPAPLTTAAAPRLRRETRRSRNPNTGARRLLWLLTNAPHSPPPVRRRLPSLARTADCLCACAHCPARPEAWARARAVTSRTGTWAGWLATRTRTPPTRALPAGGWVPRQSLGRLVLVGGAVLSRCFRWRQ